MEEKKVQFFPRAPQFMKSCIGKCKLDVNSIFCLGCGRSMKDIKQAYKEFLTEQSKSSIIKLQ